MKIDELHYILESRLQNEFGDDVRLRHVEMEMVPLVDGYEHITIELQLGENTLKHIINDEFGVTKRRNAKAKKVIFNAPATIVLWEDGTKTVVKCSNNDEYDEEKGLAMCYCKKMLGEERYKTDIIKEVKKYWKGLIDFYHENSILAKLSSAFSNSRGARVIKNESKGY